MTQELPAQLTGISVGNRDSICVLYDDAAYVEIALNRLERAGFHVFGTTDRERALLHIRFGMCRILIVDFKISQTESVTFLKRAQQIDPGICVIIATGYWIDSAIAMVMALSHAERSLAPLEEICFTYIKRVLEACRGNRRKAARILGIGRTSLYRYLSRGSKRNRYMSLPHRARSQRNHGQIEHPAVSLQPAPQSTR